MRVSRFDTGRGLSSNQKGHTVKQERIQKTRKASQNGRQSAEQDQAGTTDRASASRASQRAQRASRSAGAFLARTR